MLQPHGPIEVFQGPALSDNYLFLVRDIETGTVAAIDTPEAAAIDAALEELGWPLHFIFNTHWHPDHVGGNTALKEKHGCTIIGPAAEGDRITARDRAVVGGNAVKLGDTVFEVLDTPGHTVGHIVYYSRKAGVAFVGDTLFSLGCGRLFEGTPDEMWSSLSMLRDLPPETVIYCAHEYTAANGAFALSVDGENEDLLTRMEEVRTRRAEGLPTVPTTIALEQRTNPFLRADQPALAASVGQAGEPAVSVFAALRAAKDSF